MLTKKLNKVITNFSNSSNKQITSLKKHYKHHGFTIVELLVVIVVIGILAAITIVSYTGISQKATIASLQSDLTNAQKQLKLFQVENSAYPGEVDDCPNPQEDSLCLKSSGGNDFTTVPYVVNNSTNPQSFTLTATNGDLRYSITEDGAPIAVIPLSCPTGFIVVPGSSTYSTSDFCVMKYEAKIQGNDNGNQTYNSAFVPESRDTGTPWVSISQTNAIAEAQTACTGCHLMTEAEWMTIAQNVLSVPSNWSTGTVGSGYIFRGHSDNGPANSLAASSSDSDGYYNTGNSGDTQRRTLTLTNSEVIWDFAGNIWEWTNATIGANQQPGFVDDSNFIWRQWDNSSLLMNGLPALSQPSSTGLSGITWNSSRGIGQLNSNYNRADTRSFLRGGFWYGDDITGVLALNLNYAPNDLSNNLGFRASK